MGHRIFLLKFISDLCVDSQCLAFLVFVKLGINIMKLKVFVQVLVMIIFKFVNTDVDVVRNRGSVEKRLCSMSDHEIMYSDKSFTRNITAREICVCFTHIYH